MQQGAATGWIGAVLAGHRVDALIGEGGMGMVFRATHLKLRRTVALKILPPALAADLDFRRRFEREATIAASLEHPAVVPIYDAGHENGVLYLSMRFVDGDDLGAVLQREGPLGVERLCALLGPVADALDAVHEAGLVHRDVKPGNILIARPGRSRGGHVYLCDFGIAKGSTEANHEITSAGTYLGTLQYSSPEQIQGRWLDGRADQYGLACLAHRGLTGQVPYPRDDNAAVIYAHLVAPPPRPGLLRPDLPAGVDAAVARAAAKDPAHRFPTCSAFVDALRAAGSRTAAPPVPPRPRPHPPTTGPDRPGPPRTRPLTLPGDASSPAPTRRDPALTGTSAPGSTAPPIRTPDAHRPRTTPPGTDRPVTPEPADPAAGSTAGPSLPTGTARPAIPATADRAAAHPSPAGTTAGPSATKPSESADARPSPATAGTATPKPPDRADARPSPATRTPRPTAPEAVDPANARPSPTGTSGPAAARSSNPADAQPSPATGTAAPPTAEPAGRAADRPSAATGNPAPAAAESADLTPAGPSSPTGSTAAAGGDGSADALPPPADVQAERGGDDPSVTVTWAAVGSAGVEYKVTRLTPDGRRQVVGRTGATSIIDGAVAPGAEIPVYEVVARLGRRVSDEARSDTAGFPAMRELSVAAPRTLVVDWPDGITEAMVVVRRDRPPTSPGDPAATSWKITNMRYQLDGGVRLPPSVGLPCHVAVASCRRERGALVVAPGFGPSARAHVEE